MAWYAFQELTLELTHAEPACGEDVARLLQELSWVCTAPTGQPPTLRLAVHRHTGALWVPARARRVFRAEGFCGVELGDEFYLTDGASLLHLQPRQGQGTAQLAPTFVPSPGWCSATSGPLACSSSCGLWGSIACTPPGSYQRMARESSSLAPQAVASRPGPRVAAAGLGVSLG